MCGFALSTSDLAMFDTISILRRESRWFFKSIRAAARDSGEPKGNSPGRASFVCFSIAPAPFNRGLLDGLSVLFRIFVDNSPKYGARCL
jgi:hypothetical protein